MLKIEKKYKDGSTNVEYLPYDEIESILRDLVFAGLFEEDGDYQKEVEE